MERDRTYNILFSCNLISTHTLTWSVTAFIPWFAMTSIISTHTLTWSVTANAYITKSGMANFNSHAHVERDSFTLINYYTALNFNSHAHVERDPLPL